MKTKLEYLLIWTIVHLITLVQPDSGLEAAHLSMKWLLDELNGAHLRLSASVVCCCIII